jgi:hypothetical protein
MEFVLCRPFRALVFRVPFSQGVALGYHIAGRWPVIAGSLVLNHTLALF